MLKKHNRLALALLCFLILASCVCLSRLNLPYTMHYTISVSATKANTLEVSLKISNSVLSKGKTVSLYTGDKTIDLKSCVGRNGAGIPVRQNDDSVELSLRRGEKALLSYDISLGSVGKHGSRGNITDDYCVFDGGETFLLPTEFYDQAFPENQVVFKELSITMEGKTGWREAVPYTALKNVAWADAYDLSNDSFCMGRFALQKIPVDSGVLNVYALPDDKEAGSDSVQSGILALYRYYGTLFSYAKPNYCVVLLPPASEADNPVIGGAGTGSVCATFDAGSQRDWELLGHRMFHAYFDSLFRTREFHFSPRLWFYEGLATYYENRSMQSLPEKIQAVFPVKPTRLFTSLYNKYLYERLHEPALFSLAPMQEEKITGSENGKAQIEFLHYIQAPLVARFLEEAGAKQNKQPDFLLTYLLNHKSDPDLCDFLKLLPGILGETGRKAYEDYFLSDNVLPLWFLKDPSYSQAMTLSDLSSAERELASWISDQPEKFPLEALNLDTVRKIRNLPAFQSAAYAAAGTEKSVGDYSAAIDSLLKEYALRAGVCHVPLSDADARAKLLLDQDSLNEWSLWLKQN